MQNYTQTSLLSPVAGNATYTAKSYTKQLAKRYSSTTDIRHSKNVNIGLHEKPLTCCPQNLGKIWRLASSAFSNYHRHFIFPRYHRHFTIFIGNTLNINIWISRIRALPSRSLRSLTPLLSTFHDRTRAPFSLTNFVRLDLMNLIKSLRVYP